MGFSAKQVQALRRKLDQRQVRTREANGRELSYIEGWYAISEANRIFGFDGWNRETVNPGACSRARTVGASSRSMSPGCALRCMRTGQSSFVKATAPVKAAGPLRVKSTISPSRPQKPMPQNALWRLSVNRSDLSSIATAKRPRKAAAHAAHSARCGAQRLGFHPDDTTPIPRPSRYYGRRQTPLSAQTFATEATCS